MTNNAAAAVIVYALLQVVLSSALHTGPALFYLGILVLMGAALPFARQLERRWRGVDSSGLPSREIETRFGRDRAHLWAAAVFFPFAWIALYRVGGSLLGI